MKIPRPLFLKKAILPGEAKTEDHERNPFLLCMLPIILGRHSVKIDINLIALTIFKKLLRFCLRSSGGSSTMTVSIMKYERKLITMPPMPQPHPQQINQPQINHQHYNNDDCNELRAFYQSKYNFTPKMVKNKGLLQEEIESFKKFQKSAKSATSFWRNSDEWNQVMKKIKKFDRLRQEIKKPPQNIEQSGFTVEYKCFCALVELTDALFDYEKMKNEEFPNGKYDQDTRCKLGVVEAGKKFMRAVGLSQYVEEMERRLKGCREVQLI